MIGYLTTFDSLVDKVETSDDLAARMRAKFPTLVMTNFILRGAHVAFPD